MPDLPRSPETFGQDSSTEGSRAETRPLPPTPTPAPGKKSWWRRRWGRVLLVVVVGFGGLVAAGAVLNKTLTNELIMANFRDGVAPFEVYGDSASKGDNVEGTYRLTVKNADGSTTSLGDFIRRAYAVGVRAEVVEVTEAGTFVGVLCLGPVTEGVKGLAGYGFYVQPGGEFALLRRDPGGSSKVLKEGTDTRVATLKRVSIRCLPNGANVTVTGYTNGLEVATFQDPNGYHKYDYAGLTVGAKRAGTQVRFTRVWARVPDEQWIP
jgi:hypothetical protein